MQDLIDAIRHVHRTKVALHQSEKSLTLQVRALLRRICYDPEKSRAEVVRESHALYDAVLGKGDHPDAALALAAVTPLLAARAEVEAGRKARVKELEGLARQLPVWSAWAEGVRGFGAHGLGAIVGEAGDLSKYANPAKLWKRMGVGLVGSERQGLRSDPAEALAHGYNPARRSILFQVGEPLVKIKGPYREVYLARKEHEERRALSEGREVLPAADVTKGRDPATFITKGHVHNRARRYMEKRLLRDLWRAWRDSA